MGNLILSRGRVRHLKNQKYFSLLLKFPQFQNLSLASTCLVYASKQNLSVKLFWGKIFKHVFQICIVLSCMHVLDTQLIIWNTYFYTSISCISAFICTKIHRVSTYLNTYQIADYHIINLVIYRFHGRSSH